MEERVQKILAASGIASKRKSEEFIVKGEVKVNGKVIKLGDKADIEKDEITLNGEIIKPLDKKYFMVNKPAGYVTSTDDPHEKIIMKLFPEKIKDYGIYPVGRLDKNTSGLLLLTNDGDFANIVMHPSYKVSKKYIVIIIGRVSESDIDLLRNGVELEEGKTHPSKVSVEYTEKSTIIELEIHTGWNRQIRRMIEAVGHKILTLKRIELGKLKLGELELGEYRELTEEEIGSIKKSKKRIITQRCK